VAGSAPGFFWVRLGANRGHTAGGRGRRLAGVSKRTVPHGLPNPPEVASTSASSRHPATGASQGLGRAHSLGSRQVPPMSRDSSMAVRQPVIGRVLGGIRSRRRPAPINDHIEVETHSGALLPNSPAILPVAGASAPITKGAAATPRSATRRRGCGDGGRGGCSQPSMIRGGHPCVFIAEQQHGGAGSQMELPIRRWLGCGCHRVAFLLEPRWPPPEPLLARLLHREARAQTVAAARARAAPAEARSTLGCPGISPASEPESLSSRGRAVRHQGAEVAGSADDRAPARSRLAPQRPDGPGQAEHHRGMGPWWRRAASTTRTRGEGRGIGLQGRTAACSQGRGGSTFSFPLGCPGQGPLMTLRANWVPSSRSRPCSPPASRFLPRPGIGPTSDGAGW